MDKKALIVGLKGFFITKNEKIFLKKNKPWGVILFSRNVKNLNQLKQLVKNIKKTFNDDNYPILIDQEGGAVSRLNNIINLNHFSQEFFGKLYSSNKSNFDFYYKSYLNGLSNLLKDIGININTIPVLDIKKKYTHKIIGSRSYSSNPFIVSKLGKICVDIFNKNKIATVIKHIPGHGSAKVDSHIETPVVKNNKENLIKNDFMPFKNSKSFFAMTGHIIYNAYDKNNTATHSKIVIKEVIRKNMNFRGIIISDDISMKSLKYDLELNAIKAINSGCNLILHCNGNLKEMWILAKKISQIDNFTRRKTSEFYNFLG